MSTPLTNKDLLAYLKSLDFHAGFVDRLKVYYRPLVCPFVELIGLARQGEKVGDIGCGSGQFGLLLAHFAKPSFVFGIEISERLVNNARQLFDKYAEPGTTYAFEVFDGVVFPDRIGELDVIYLNDVLHHVPAAAQERFMHDLIAKMKSGARLVLKDINGASPLVYCNKMHDLLFAHEIGHELPWRKAKAWLENNKLIVTEFTKKRMYVYPHYCIVAQKP
ncbi:MAG: class I SAM-dependent methyltransferase [Bacteroidota bacterium]|nr:class I SAM-dependent methyltransferase [Bacteroidota bacterium]MDP4254338.1 class I SAM-dependent methyltransferase [Bacteroidota bacterium]MDP4260385.1 class I SAM-dependent methyltransferase [Bacteroidota bacterium]